MVELLNYYMKFGMNIIVIYVWKFFFKFIILDTLNYIIKLNQLDWILKLK
jgi:hypothetical protein